VEQRGRRLCQYSAGGDENNSEFGLQGILSFSICIWEGGTLGKDIPREEGG